MGRKSIPNMTYEQLQEECDKNLLLKEQLISQSENETNSKALLDLSRKILSLARRNERLAQQQVCLMKEQLYELSKPKPEPLPKQELKTKKSTDKKKKLKKPSEMLIDELQEEIESNNARCEQLEEQRESTDINTRIESDQEIRTLANRTSKLCEQKIALLNHQMSLLRQGEL